MKRLVSLLVLAALACTAPARAAVAPGAAGVLSVLPGLGQVAAGNGLEGLAWFGSVAGLYFSGSQYNRDIAKNLWFYNMYDAYRDAGAADTGKQTALQNGISFLDPTNIFDPFSVLIVGYGAYSASGSGRTVKQGPRGTLKGVLLFGTVGLGEEGLFRGFLFPGISHLTNSYALGAVGSSALFAALHLGNKDPYYKSAKGLGTLFLAGLVLCMQTYHQKWDLRHSIFAHAWFDILVEYAKIGDVPSLGSVEPVPMARLTFDF